MTLYICAENQTKLWQAVQTSPFFSVFSPHPFSKEEWFRSAIERFHSISPRVNGTDTLKRMNRDTLAYLVSSMRTLSPIQHVPISPSSSIKSSSNSSPSRSHTRAARSDARTEAVSASFDERSREYENMRRGPEPTEISFQSSIKDEHLEDIAALVQKQIEERNLDAQTFFAPPISDALAVSSSNASSQETRVNNFDSSLNVSIPTKDFSKGGIEDRLRKLEAIVEELRVDIVKLALERISDKGDRGNS